MTERILWFLNSLVFKIHFGNVKNEVSVINWNDWVGLSKAGYGGGLSG